MQVLKPLAPSLVRRCLNISKVVWYLGC